MLRIALSSLRYRSGGFAASVITMLLGAVILMAFASMFDTRAGAAVRATDAETLVNMGTVVGGWGMVIVVFAVASTLTLAVRQRNREMALLKSVGATPAQIRRMIVVEAALLASVAVLVAIPPAVLAGRGLFALLQGTGQVAPAVDYRFGPIAIGMGIGITLVSAVIAALVAARRAARVGATDALLAAAIERPGTGRKRVIAAWLLLAGGISCAAVTATVFNGKGTDAMQTGAQACILSSIGLALLAPVLVRWVTEAAAGTLLRRGGASGFLAVQNLRRNRQHMARVLAPIIVFTGIAVGCFSMQDIENAAVAAAGVVMTNEQENIQTLNYGVVTMIAVFAAITMVNAIVAGTASRRRELGQQRLAGSTPPQVLGMIGLESLVLAASGVVFGSLASLTTIVPFSIARAQSVIPDTTVAIFAGVVVVAAALTIGAGVGTARRATRVPAVDAVGVSA